MRESQDDSGKGTVAIVADIDDVVELELQEVKAGY